MRIGAFACKNEVSIETVRYYMELGLIVPVKKGGQYDFGDNCQKYMTAIILYKSMGFTLQEIKKIFHFTALSRLHSNSERAYYKDFFSTNLERINADIVRLLSARRLVEDALDSFDVEGAGKNSVIGIPLKMLDFLVCPKCRGQLELGSGSVEENKVVSGSLKCACGCTYEIEEGILLIDPVFEDVSISSESDTRVEYFESTSEEYIEKIFIAGAWLGAVIQNLKEGMCVLEPGIGFGYALSQIINHLPKQCLYIGVDHNMNRLKVLKDYFEKSKMEFDLVLIASDFINIPLKDNTIDVVMDMSGSSNRAFDSDDFLLRDIDHLIKEKALLYGLYILAEGMDQAYFENSSTRLFTEASIKEEIQALDYKINYETKTGKVTTGGPYESFVDHVKSTWTYCCYGER